MILLKKEMNVCEPQFFNSLKNEYKSAGCKTLAKIFKDLDHVLGDGFVSTFFTNSANKTMLLQALQSLPSIGKISAPSADDRQSIQKLIFQGIENSEALKGHKLRAWFTEAEASALKVAEEILRLKKNIIEKSWGAGGRIKISNFEIGFLINMDNLLGRMMGQYEKKVGLLPIRTSRARIISECLSAAGNPISTGVVNSHLRPHRSSNLK